MKNTIKNQINEIEETYNEFKVLQKYDHQIGLGLPGHSLYIEYEESGWFFQLSSDITGSIIEESYNLSFNNLLEELSIYYI